MLAVVGANAFPDRRHQCAQEVAATHDEAKLLVGVKCGTDWQQVDFDVDDLASRKLLRPVEV
ncbi:hypothetical protein DSM43276_03319 [Mycobacteroides salmoniphilum]|nr:hypothetical protein [Mycobacteroides salmoniphilum]QCH25046.1 hypothetical protein DSM43276_03319 [Mycobacteroides salmoniphilum]